MSVRIFFLYIFWVFFLNKTKPQQKKTLHKTVSEQSLFLHLRWYSAAQLQVMVSVGVTELT